MDISCTICSENYDMISDIRATLCGHIFHYDCITSWLERSSSCPQCRKYVYALNLHRIYLNFERNENDYHSSNNCDAEVLRQQLEILQMENESLRDRINSNTENLEEMQAINMSLQDMVIKNSDIEQLNQQLQFAVAQNVLLQTNLDEYQTEIAELKLKNLSITQEVIPKTIKLIEDLQEKLQGLKMNENRNDRVNVEALDLEDLEDNGNECNRSNNSTAEARNKKVQFKKEFDNLKKATFNLNRNPNIDIFFGLNDNETKLIEDLVKQIEIKDN